jgi:hypothetical protein
MVGVLKRGGGSKKWAAVATAAQGRRWRRQFPKKYAFIAGTCVPSGAWAYWAGWLAGPRTAVVQLGRE